MAAHGQSSPERRRLDVPASVINMFSVGTVYALSMIQFELPRLFPNVSSAASSYSPFACASFGLAIGVAICAPLVAWFGPRAIAACGTITWGLALLLAGSFLSRTDLRGFLVSIAVGGIGVGWTYLAVIILVGQVLPPESLLRTAIGPLGFSSGAAALTLVSFACGFSNLDQNELGSILQLGGIIIAAGGIAILTFLSAVTSQHGNRHNTSIPRSQGNRIHFGELVFYWTLLFFNALAGMAVFGALRPIASYHLDGDTHIAFFLHGLAMALALGGLLSPYICTWLGPKRTFMCLFGFRAIMFIVFSQFPRPSILCMELAVVLFSHGAGFSLLPGLIKARLGKDFQFAHFYGLVLTAWGIAGVVAQVVNFYLTPSSGDFVTTSFVLGLLTLACSVGVCLFGSVGRRM